MAKTFKKIGGYTSIVTVMGAVVSAPVQATSLINTSEAGTLITQIENHPAANNDTGEFNSTLEFQDKIKPQILGEPEFTPRNQVWHGLPQELEDTIDAVEQASTVAEVEINDGKTAYIDQSIEAEYYNTLNTNYGEYHTNIYSNISKASTPHLKRKVPEPSVLPGVIAIFCYFATRRYLIKKS